MISKRTMYSYLQGKISEITPAYAVIDCSGVGYMVHISLNTYMQIKENEYAKILTHLIVREDAQMLFGFADESERKLFLHLISVSGVGASTARIILSAMSPMEIVSAIVGEDVKRLQSVKGIGAKSAQRIIVDLKDKVDKEQDVAMPNASTRSVHFDEALSALVMLGFAKTAVEKVLQAINKQHGELSTEELVKQALKML